MHRFNHAIALGVPLTLSTRGYARAREEPD